MKAVNVSYSVPLGVCVSLLATAAPGAAAKDAWAGTVLDQCPVQANIRVASGDGTERFTALSSCGGQIIAAPSPQSAPAPDMVRIIGVKVRPEDKDGRRDQGEPITASDNSRVGRVYRASYAATPWDGAIERAATAYRIDPLFLHAVIRNESGYRPTIVSNAGAVGLMQIMPGTGRRLGLNRNGLLDGAANIDAGARELKRLQRRYGTNFDLILAGYNAGEGAVARYGNRVPAYRETQAYVRNVMGSYRALRAGAGR